MPRVLEPREVSGRNRALELMQSLPSNLDDQVVTVDFDGVRVAAPSFVDEIIRVALVERRASKLRLLNASPAVGRLADQSAHRREVSDRLFVDRRVV